MKALKKKQLRHPVSLRVRDETRKKVEEVARAAGLSATYVYLTAMDEGLPTVAKKLEGLRLSRKEEADQGK